MLNPNDPLAAWNILKTEDAQNVIDVQHFFTSKLDLTTLKKKYNSCLHRQIKFVKFYFDLRSRHAGTNCGPSKHTIDWILGPTV